jgi:hypothetical protein
MRINLKWIGQEARLGREGWPTVIQGERIETQGLCINDVLTSVRIDDLADYVVRRFDQQYQNEHTSPIVFSHWPLRPSPLD